MEILAFGFVVCLLSVIVWGMLHGGLKKCCICKKWAWIRNDYDGKHYHIDCAFRRMVRLDYGYDPPNNITRASEEV